MEIIKETQEYPFKNREELLKEYVIYQAGCFIQVKGENKRYIADGVNHFKDLKNFFDFPDDMEIGYDGVNFRVIKKA